MSVAGSLRYMRERNLRIGQLEELSTVTAAEFLVEGGPAHARVFDRRGRELERFQRSTGESFETFRDRACARAQGLAGAARLALGGLGCSETGIGPYGVPRGAVRLQDVPLHASQREAVALVEANRRVCLVCGRRWGKSTVIVTLAVDSALACKNVAVLAPTYKFLKPLVDQIAFALSVAPGVVVNRTAGETHLRGGGRIDFWSVDVTGRGGRGKGYHLVLVDEAAHDEGYLASTLELAIAPATIDFQGKIVLASTPNGLEGAFWEAANTPEKGYVVHHAPTSVNPYLPSDEIAWLRTTLRSEVASQELDAVFLDVSGAAIFSLTALLVDGEPHADTDWTCDYVGVTIDSNSGKGGPDRDGTAACVFGVTLPNIMYQGSLVGARVVILDWDIQSLSQGGVTSWLEHVRALTMSWFFKLRPIHGLPRLHVEPAGNAPSIIEICKAQGMHPNEIDAKLVALGKDGRALATEPHVNSGRVKIGKSALEKRTNYRGVTANHLVRQVTNFKTFDKDAYKREDDLLDAAVYAMLVSFGSGTEMRWSQLKRPPLAAE
jgi:hypothetical protein